MSRFFLLDRDGILNQDIGFIYEPHRIIIPEGVTEALLHLTQIGFRFVVITNQSGIARGLFNSNQLEEFNTYLQSLYVQKGIWIEDFFYCPHLPQITGECLCRKPKSLLVEKAIAKYQVDVKNSYMIGDNPRDVIAGKNVGLKTILIHNEPHSHADYHFETLVDWYKNMKNWNM
ncbi:MAG: HAD family hydrolase [Bacteroidia bacterium]|nr:HAD family hydrolase [Bacteroidia bacterium]MDW8346079.1 HAD family hydrolase [Bacteroidia bacterium]